MILRQQNKRRARELILIPQSASDCFKPIHHTATTFIKNQTTLKVLQSTNINNHQEIPGNIVWAKSLFIFYIVNCVHIIVYMKLYKFRSICQNMSETVRSCTVWLSSSSRWAFCAVAVAALVGFVIDMSRTTSSKQLEEMLRNDIWSKK